MEPEYLTPAEVSRRLGGRISTKTLANWRSQRNGPPYRRLGGRVLYPLDEFEAWNRATGRPASAPPSTDVREEPAPPWVVDDPEIAPDEVGLPPGLRWLLRRQQSWEPVSTSSAEIIRQMREDEDL